MSERTNRDFLSDILEAARRTATYTAALQYEEFLRDTKTQDAVVRNLEIIGEATKKLSAGLRAKHPDIPWRSMAGVRDRLIHDYLKEQKCKIDWVRDWKKAIHLLSQEKKDLMILSLPSSGSDGLKLCKRLKGLENTKSMPIMVLTSRKDLATSVSRKDFGVDEFMITPFNKEEFRARINQ